MPEFLTICIPTYNRPGYLQQCLESILAQSFQDYRVIILDNASERDYSPVLVTCRDARIQYTRNKRNIGAAGNIAKALREYRQTRYLMVFHDDDIMHPKLLETEVAILEQSNDIQFVASEMMWFVGQPNPFPTEPSVHHVIFQTAADLTQALLRGADLHFGSVMYRASALSGVEPDLVRFSIIADRPFLLDLARKGRCALITQPFVLYRDHSAQDSKTDVLTENHIIELYRAYREAMNDSWGIGAAWLFYRVTGFELLDAYGRLLPENRSHLVRFLHKCYRAKVLSYPFILAYPLTRGRRWLAWKGWPACRRFYWRFYWRLYALVSALIPLHIRRRLRQMPWYRQIRRLAE